MQTRMKWMRIGNPGDLYAVDEPRLARLYGDEKVVGYAEEGGHEAAGDAAADNRLRPGPRQTLNSRSE